MESDYQYILRLCIAPGHHEAESIQSMMRFCEDAGIDEVALFSNCEEINTGHATPPELAEWLRVIRDAQQELSSASIRTSINPWETILHGDRGRSLKPGQDFRLMVDCNGRQAAACVCPLCSNWQQHIADAYASHAELHPHVLWIEDDFRFHNHAPLAWGCFCDEHMRLISEVHGSAISREELAQAIAAPGTPHPLRKQWLDLSRRTMIDLATKITAAVHAVSPSTKMGLMTSKPAVHCAEGRDWHALINALGGADRCVVRPHLPMYREVSPAAFIWHFPLSRQTVELLPRGTSVHPETDNGPHSLYSKSRQMMGFQISLATVLGATGMTLNIFDMIGNGPIFEEGYQSKLKSIKPFLDYVLRLNLTLDQVHGITVPFCDHSSYTLDPAQEYNSDGASGGDCPMPRLYPDESKWASLLTSFGFSTRVSSSLSYSGETLAISGQWLRNLDRGQIVRLFEENAVILDASGVMTLCDLGLGELAGIRRIQSVVPSDSGTVAYEEVVDGTLLAGKGNVRLSSQGSAGRAAIIEYEESVRIVTELKDYWGKTTGPGIAIHKEKCMVFPYFFPDTSETCTLHTLRQFLFARLISGLACTSDQVSYCADHPYLAVFRFELPESVVCLLANASADKARDPSICLGGVSDGQHEVEICDNAGVVTKHSVTFSEGLCRVPIHIPAMEMVSVKLNR